MLIIFTLQNGGTTGSFCTFSWLLFFPIVVLDFKQAPISLTGLFVSQVVLSLQEELLVPTFYSFTITHSLWNSRSHTCWSTHHHSGLLVFSFCLAKSTNIFSTFQFSLLLAQTVNTMTEVIAFFSFSYDCTSLEGYFSAFCSCLFTKKPDSTIKSSRYVKQKSHTQCRSCRNVCRFHLL